MVHRFVACIVLVVSLLACGGPAGEPEPQPLPEAPPPPATKTVAEFNGASFELPESVAFHQGQAYVSFLNGAVTRVAPDGKRTDFGSVPIAPAGSAYGLGLAVGPDGAVYLAMAKASATSAFAAGVYRIPPSGGTGALFASNAEMNVPNDVDLDAAGNLYITDAPSGTIFKKTGGGAGATTIWLRDPLLAPVADAAAGPCGARGTPFPIGVNGIVVESGRVVVNNSENASLVRIAINGEGSAGTAANIVTNPGLLCGADGLARDADGSYLATVQSTSSLVRIAPDGSSIKVLHTGTPFRSPAAVDVGAWGTERRALVASPDFGALFTGGNPAPNLSSVPL